MLFYGDCGKSMVRRLNSYKDKEIPYDDKLQKLDKSVHSQEQLTKDIYENFAQEEDRLKRFKKFLGIDKLDRMAIVTFVDRILIFEDKTIQIFFKYQNEFDKAKVVVDSLDLEVV
ncbi:MAG: hypothetical protein ACERLG_00115 [Sedimentibacter sp.]